MFKLVKKLGTLVVRLYRAEAVRLSKLSDAQASRDSRLAALDIQSKAKQLETLF